MISPRGPYRSLVSGMSPALSQVDSAPPDDFEDDPLPEPAKKGAT